MKNLFSPSKVILLLGVLLSGASLLALKTSRAASDGVDGNKILFYDDCEASNKPQFGPNVPAPIYWSGRQGLSSVGGTTRSTEYKRRGNYSYKHVLRDSSLNSWEGLKAELSWNFLPAGSPLGTVGNNEAYYREPLGLRWMAASILIPSYNKDFNTVTGIGFNTKAVEDDYPTPTYLAMEQGRYYLFITQVNANGSTTILKRDAGAVVKDKWEDWVLYRNFTSNAYTGFVKLYKNGQLIVDFVGGNWKDDNKHSREPYMQMGLYKWAFRDGWSPKPDVSEVTMFMDEIRFGTEQASLDDFLLTSQNPAPAPSPTPTPKPTVMPTPSPTFSPPPTSSAGCIDVAQNSYGRASCPAGQTITGIQFASYGTPKGTCGNFSVDSSCHASTSTKAVGDRCLGKTDCSIFVIDRTFGDPCVGRSKKLAVQYSCGAAATPPPTAPPPAPEPAETRKCLQVSQNTSAAPSCPSGQTIHAIEFASYGTPNGSCGAYSISGCHARSSATVARASCVGKTRCSLYAADWIFGDPCLRVTKRLYLQYTCR